MNNATIKICDLDSVRILLRQLGHLRLWITKMDLSTYGEGIYYSVIDQNERVLAEWCRTKKCWELREAVWQLILDPDTAVPAEFLVEIIDGEQIFSFCLVEEFY